MTVTATKKPELTLPETEVAFLRGAYDRASVILEYGSGGSTVMASQMAGKTVTSVESDEDWAAMMGAWFDQNPPVVGSDVNLHWADIGPTKDWGFPRNNGRCRDFPNYALGIWHTEGFQQPDVVFIDGRFRAACLFATAIHTTRPVDVLVDDYIDRPNYHAVEDWFGVPKMIGRMAAFTLEPMQVTARDLLAISRFLVIPG